MAIYNLNDFMAMAKDLLLPKIYCDDDVYTSEPISFAEGNWFDKTACEALINHIHLELIFDYNNIDELREAGIVLAKLWCSRLKAEFPNKTFMVFLTVDEADEDDEYSFTSCTLRYCLKREDEPTWSDEKTNGTSFFVWET